MSVKVMIDAGHYGPRYNASPVVSEYAESAQMWVFSQLLGEALRQYGITVGFTRIDRDKDFAVYDRGKKAAGCDLFLSLHSNALTFDNAKPLNHPDNAAKEAVDRVVIFKPLKGSDTLANMLSTAISSTMQITSRPQVTTRPNESGREYYGVMRGASDTDCPEYYIIEHSFHTNKKAATWLLDRNNLQKLSLTEAATIASYYKIKPPPHLAKFGIGDKVKVVKYQTTADGRKRAELFGGDTWVVWHDEYTVSTATRADGRTVLSDNNGVIVSAVPASILALNSAPGPIVVPFPDVPPNAWYTKVIDELKTAGIVDGYPDGTVRPEATATRAELFKVAYELLKIIAK